MTRSTRMFWVILPLAIIATAGITVAIATVPWGSMPRRLGTVGMLISRHVVPWFQRDKPIVPTPVLDHTIIIELTGEPIMDEPATEDAELVMAAPTVETAPSVVEMAEPHEPVDYSRLNNDVMHVADALDRFNQKLLRMIAQAKASQRYDASTPDQAETAQSPQDSKSAGASTATWYDEQGEATN